MVTLPEPVFLQGVSGRILVLHLPPEGSPRGALIYLPPFAEEMNRCRATVLKQAQALCRQGYGCLLLDPFGTGDSEGELADASWETWVRDLVVAADWLRDRGYADVALWGFRLGALIAADAAGRHPDRFRRLLLCQPVQDGRMFMTQYLRLRVAFVMDRGLPAETTEGMRERLAAGEVLEVAGYELSGRLTADIDQHKLAALPAGVTPQIAWLEHVAEPGQAIGVGSQRTISRLQELGCTVQAATFSGPPIWQLHKRDELPDLIEKTGQLLEAWE